MRDVVRPLLIALPLLVAGAAEAGHPPAAPPREAGFAEIRGISMYYRVYGEGPGEPVLMIHGGLGSADVWNEQVAALALDRTVVVADSRGQGRSGRTAEPITYEAMAEDYVALLDRLGLGKVALVGWSDGGIIGLEIAIRHPERLARLFVQAANTTPAGLVPPPRADAPRPELRHYDDVRDEIHALWANEPHITDAELAGIRVPTVVAIGEHDEAVSIAHDRAIAAAIPGARFLLLPDVGHAAVLEDPAGYTRAVLDFLGE